MSDEFEGTPGEAAEAPSDAESPEVAPQDTTPRSLSEVVPEVVVGEGASDDIPTVADEASPFDEKVAEIAASLEVAEDEPVEAEIEAEVGDPESDEGAGGETDAGAPAPVAEAPVIDTERVAWWPFITYGAAWLAFAGVLGWLLYSAPSGVPSVEVTYYPYTVMAGVALTFLGPVLALVFYINGRDTAASQSGFFATLLLRAATTTLVGVAVWWLVLIAADMYRLGRFF